jgi:hypothetical protein
LPFWLELLLPLLVSEVLVVLVRSVLAWVEVAELLLVSDMV